MNRATPIGPSYASPSPRRRVLQVARGAPAKTGVTSFVETIMEADAVRREFDLELLNTTRRSKRRGGTAGGRTSRSIRP